MYYLLRSVQVQSRQKRVVSKQTEDRDPFQEASKYSVGALVACGTSDKNRYLQVGRNMLPERAEFSTCRLAGLEILEVLRWNEGIQSQTEHDSDEHCMHAQCILQPDQPHHISIGETTGSGLGYTYIVW